MSIVPRLVMLSVAKATNIRVSVVNTVKHMDGGWGQTAHAKMPPSEDIR